MTAPPLRVALIGVGYGASVHMPVVTACPDAVLVSLTDNGSGRAASLAGPGVDAFGDWRQAIETSAADVVIVAVPPPAQHAIVLAAMARGAHVLCEKPVATSLAACELIRDTARLQGVIAAAGFQFRFESGVQRLRKEILSGNLGALRSIEFQWHTSGRADPALPIGWQYERDQGGGILFSHMVHLIDLVGWLGAGVIGPIGGRLETRIPFRPDANGQSLPADADDFAACWFKTDTETIGYASVGNSQPGGRGLRIVVLGSAGTAVFSHAPPFRPTDQKLEIRTNSGDVSTSGDDHEAADSRIGPASRLFDRFAAAIRGSGGEGLPTVADACHVHAALERLKRADDDEGAVRSN